MLSLLLDIELRKLGIFSKMDKQKRKKFDKQQKDMKEVVCDDYARKIYENAIKKPKINV